MNKRLGRVILLLALLSYAPPARAESAPESTFDHDLGDVTAKLEGGTLKPEELHAFFAKYLVTDGHHKYSSNDELPRKSNVILSNKVDQEKLSSFINRHLDTQDNDAIRSEFRSTYVAMLDNYKIPKGDLVVLSHLLTTQHKSDSELMPHIVELLSLQPAQIINNVTGQLLKRALNSKLPADDKATARETLKALDLRANSRAGLDEKEQERLTRSLEALTLSDDDQAWALHFIFGSTGTYNRFSSAPPRPPGESVTVSLLKPLLTSTFLSGYAEKKFKELFEPGTETHVKALAAVELDSMHALTLAPRMWNQNFKDAVAKYLHGDEATHQAQAWVLGLLTTCPDEELVRKELVTVSDSDKSAQLRYYALVRAIDLKGNSPETVRTLMKDARELRDQLEASVCKEFVSMGMPKKAGFSSDLSVQLISLNGIYDALFRFDPDSLKTSLDLIAGTGMFLARSGLQTVSDKFFKRYFPESLFFLRFEGNEGPKKWEDLVSPRHLQYLKSLLADKAQPVEMRQNAVLALRQLGISAIGALDDLAKIENDKDLEPQLIQDAKTAREEIEKAVRDASLDPSKPILTKDLKKYVNDLDEDDFDKRAEAFKQLHNLSDPSGTACDLKARLLNGSAAPLSTEQKARIREILEIIDPDSAPKPPDLAKACQALTARSSEKGK